MNTPRTYRTKPVEIEAIQFAAGDEAHLGPQIAAWCGGRYEQEHKTSDHTDIAHRILIPTLEGTMRANPGDWIIHGTAGEFYPCRDDIFQTKYEVVA